MNFEGVPMTRHSGVDESNSEIENPYAPPAAPLDVPDGQLAESQFPIASAGKRFGNLLIDRLACVLLQICVGAGLGLLERFGLITGAVAWFQDSSWLESMTFGLAVTLAYYTACERVGGRTLGKLLTGTLVITTEGTRPTLKQIVGRSLSRCVPFEPFSFLGGSPSGWHDKWSGTCVVDVRAGRAALRSIGKYS